MQQCDALQMSGAKRISTSDTGPVSRTVERKQIQLVVIIIIIITFINVNAKASVSHHRNTLLQYLFRPGFSLFRSICAQKLKRMIGTVRARETKFRRGNGRGHECGAV
jgi:hypothetical protein